MIIATDEQDYFDTTGLAAKWQVRTIEDKMELARMTDKQRQYVQDKLKSELSFEQADEVLKWMDQFMDAYPSHKAIVNEIRKKIDSHE